MYFAIIRKGVTLGGDPFFSFIGQHNKRTFMTGLDIPVEFLDIEDLAQRWKCRISTIESLAETDKIKFCLRPAALEVALARTPPEKYNAMVRQLAGMHIDHRYVYLMFKDKEHKIEITRIGDCDMKEILTGPLRVDFFDLIIPLRQVKDFESRHRNLKEYEFEPLADDFTRIRWYGKEYRFGENQAKVIKRLWQAREDGQPWMYGKHVLRDVESNCYRIRDVFGHNKHWRKLIRSDENGKYCLNLPPRQLNLFGQDI